MKKSVSPFFIILPVILLLSLFRIGPALQTIISSLQSSNISGVPDIDSAWVGFSNYAELFGPQYQVLGNALIRSTVLNGVAILSTCLAAYCLIHCVQLLPRLIREASFFLILLPGLLPSSVLFMLLRLWNPLGIMTASISTSSISIIASTLQYLIRYTVFECLHFVWVPVLVGVLVPKAEFFRSPRIVLGNLKQRRSENSFILRVLLVYGLLRATLILTPDLELMLLSSQMQSSGGWLASDHLNMIMKGDQTLNYGLNASVWVVKTIIQIGIGWFVWQFVYRVHANEHRLSQQDIRVRHLNAAPVISRHEKTLAWLPAIVGIIVLLPFLLIVISLLIPSLFTSSIQLGSPSLIEGLRALGESGVLVRGVQNSLFYGCVGGVFGGLFALLFAYVLHCIGTKKQPFIMVVLFALVSNRYGEYMLASHMELLNTMLPIALISGLSMMGGLAIAWTVEPAMHETTLDFSSFFHKAWVPMLFVMLLLFLQGWGTMLPQHHLLTDRSLFGLGMLGSELVKASAVPGNSLNIQNLNAAFSLVASIPAILSGILMLVIGNCLPKNAWLMVSRLG